MFLYYELWMKVYLYLLTADVTIISRLCDVVRHFFGHVFEEIGSPIAPVEAAAEVDGGNHHANRNDRGQAEDQNQWNFG